MTPRQLTVPEAAACLVLALERRGAVFTLDAQDYVRCDLNGVHDIYNADEAEAIANIILVLVDEIRAVLQAQRVHH